MHRLATIHSEQTRHTSVCKCCRARHTITILRWYLTGFKSIVLALGRHLERQANALVNIRYWKQ